MLANRFQVSGETFVDDNRTMPDFANASSWFDLYVFPGKIRTDPIQPATHAASVSKMLKAAGIVTKKVTHSFRGCASRMADLGGASESDIGRAGRWDVSCMNQYYLTTLPRGTMRVLAGFTAEPGTFWIARDIDAPEELESMVFPDVDLWYVSKIFSF